MDEFSYAANSVAANINNLATTVANARASQESSEAYLQAMRETNEMNYRIAQETNQANLDMYREQFADSISAWKMQNAYNDPSAQRARMSAAGYNPALALGNSTASGSVSMPSSAPAVGATMQVAPYDVYQDSAMHSLGNSLAQLGNTQEQFERIRGMRIDNNTRDAYNQVNINKALEELYSQRENRNLSARQRAYLDDQIDSLRLLNRFNSDSYMDRLTSLSLDNDAKRLNMRLSQEANDRDAARLVIERYNAQSQRALNAKQMWQIGEMVRLANQADWRDALEHRDEHLLRSLDYSLKSLDLGETDNNDT